MTHRATPPDVKGVRSEGQIPPRQPSDVLLAMLIVTGFFIGPIKMLGNSWFSYLGVDLLAGLVLLIVLLGRIVRRQPLIAASPLTGALLTLGVLCLLETANPDAPFVRTVLGLRSWLLYSSFYFVGLYTLRSVRQVERLYLLLISLGVLTALYGLYQWRAGPEHFASWSDAYGRYATVMWSAQTSSVVFRAFSTFTLPNTFGTSMAFLMLLAFSVLASTEFAARWRVLAAGAFVILGAGIAASGSRAPLAQLLLAAAVGVVLVPGLWRRVRAGLLAAGLVSIGVLVVNALLAGPSIADRYVTILDPSVFFWKWFAPLADGVRLAWDHPFGLGLGYTAGVPAFISNPAVRELPRMSIDSGYGSAAGDLGFPGLALFGYLAFKVGVSGFIAWRRLRPGRLRDLLLGPTLLACTYPAMSLVVLPQAVLPNSIYFWILIGLLMKAPDLQNTIATQPSYVRVQ